MPVVAGDLAAALRRPDGLVLTQATAAKYFGDGSALDQPLTIGGTVMTVRAVIADLPATASDLQGGLFAAGGATQSSLTKQANAAAGGFSIESRTYLRLQPGTDPAVVEAKLAPLMAGVVPPPMREAYTMALVRVDKIALEEGFFPGVAERLKIGSLVALLVLFIAVANFVNLSVALASRRQREIGVRKAHGASRGQLMAQFMGETGITVLIAAILAVICAALLLPAMNAFLDTKATIDPIGQPVLLLWFVLGVVVLTLVAGSYPAFILSAFPPARILRGRAATYVGGGVRTALVIAQFAVLIGLIVATAVVHMQRDYAMNDAIRADIDQVLTVAAPCPTGFRQQVERLSGVRATSCSGGELLTGKAFAFIRHGDGEISTDIVAALPSLYALYGIKPVAGTLVGLPPAGEETITRIVINETAVGRYGFGSNSAALGKQIAVPGDLPDVTSYARVVAVVPDFALYSAETAIKPTIYVDHLKPDQDGLVSIKLAGSQIPETLAGIDAAWQATGATEPIDRAFVLDHIEELYRGLARNTKLFALFSLLSVLLACLGLIALAVAAADRRIKEIGVRKAMGADTRQIQALLLWQFSKPVLIANLIAWPLTWWIMTRWLNGYAYHIDLPLWLFPLAGVAALVFALLTVGWHSYTVARRKPIHALRYE